MSNLKHKRIFTNDSTPSGGVQSVISGTDITVDNTDPSKVFILLNNSLGVGYKTYTAVSSLNSIFVATFNTGSYSDDVLLDPTSILIKVYP